MGIVEEAGTGVTRFSTVIAFCAVSYCVRRLLLCQHDLPGHCEHSNPEKYGPNGGLLDEKGGALFGYTDLYGGYDGGQAQFVRVPSANNGPRRWRLPPTNSCSSYSASCPRAMPASTGRSRRAARLSRCLAAVGRARDEKRWRGSKARATSSASTSAISPRDRAAPQIPRPSMPRRRRRPSSCRRSAT